MSYVIRNPEGTYNGKSVFASFRLASYLAACIREARKDPTIGVVELESGRFLSEVFDENGRPLSRRSKH